MKKNQIFEVIRIINEVAATAAGIAVLGIICSTFSREGVNVNSIMTVIGEFLILCLGFALLVSTEEWWDKKRAKYGEYHPAILQPEYDLLSDNLVLTERINNFFDRIPDGYAFGIDLVMLGVCVYFIIFFEWNYEAIILLSIAGVISTLIVRTVAILAFRRQNNFSFVSKSIKYLR